MIALPFTLSPRSKPFILTLSIAILLVAVGAGGAYYISHNRLQSASSSSTTDQQRATSSTGATVSQTVQTTNTPTPTPTPAFLVQDLGSGVSKVTSNDLGVAFKFGNTIDNGGGKYLSVVSKEVGNKIYLYPSDQTIGVGTDFVQVFAKSPTDTLSQAITKTILSGYSASDCPITSGAAGSSFPSTFQGATISYAPANIWPESGDAKDSSKCPVDYTHTADNDHLTFLMDPSHPDRFLFVSDGGDLNLPALVTDWTATISIF